MPDADKVHSGLSYRHQKVYKQICEGVMTPGELAYEELGAMKGELRNCGQTPFLLIPEAVKLLNIILPGHLLNSTVDWNGICRDIQKKGQMISLQTATKKRVLDLAVEACIDLVRDIQQGAVSDDLEVDMMERFATKVYEAEFEGRLPLTHHHYLDVTPEFVNNRVKAMRQPMEDGLRALAKQAIRDGHFNKLVRPARPAGTIQTIDLGTDLLTFGAAP